MNICGYSIQDLLSERSEHNHYQSSYNEGTMYSCLFECASVERRMPSPVPIPEVLDEHLNIGASCEYT